MGWEGLHSLGSQPAPLGIPSLSGNISTALAQGGHCSLPGIFPGQAVFLLDFSGVFFGVCVCGRFPVFLEDQQVARSIG